MWNTCLKHINISSDPASGGTMVVVAIDRDEFEFYRIFSKKQLLGIIELFPKKGDSKIGCVGTSLKYPNIIFLQTTNFWKNR